MKTAQIKPTDIKKNWVTVDASGQVLGRLASQIAYVLRGKHKANFVPYWDAGDNVVVTNAAQIKMTGRKMTDKMYHHHSGYSGGIKSASAKEILAKKPEKLLMLAVKRMLPQNKLTAKMLKSLKIYAGTQHPHSAQKPAPMAARTRKGDK